MKKKSVNIKVAPNDTKTPSFTNVKEVITVTNDELFEDVFYKSDSTHIPEKKDIARCYRSNFKLKTKKEAEKIIKEKKIAISEEDKNADFFVYNERTNGLVPFKKNDYLMYEHEYLTFDGTNYITRDNDGNEIGRF